MYGIRGLGDACSIGTAQYDPVVCAALTLPCTCVAGVCAESGDSCSSSSTPASLLAAQQANAQALAANAAWTAANNPQTLTQWLNANSTLAIGGVAAFALLLMMAKR